MAVTLLIKEVIYICCNQKLFIIKWNKTTNSH
jgi:hypothetical protein